MKKEVRSNFRAVVYPYENKISTPTPDESRENCQKLRAEINRHVDEISDVHVVWDTSIECSFCGYGWEAALDENGSPVCCDKAIEEETERRKKEA